MPPLILCMPFQLKANDALHTIINSQPLTRFFYYNKRHCLILLAFSLRLASLQLWPTGAYWSSNVYQRVSQNIRGSAVQTQLERRCRKLIYTTRWSSFTTTKWRRGYKSNRSAEKTPSGKVPAYAAQKLWPNEFMAAELISCAIKVLRFFHATPSTSRN